METIGIALEHLVLACVLAAACSLPPFGTPVRFRGLGFRILSLGLRLV